MRKAMRRSAAEQTLRAVEPFGMESLQERTQAERAKTVIARVQKQVWVPQHSLPGLARSSPEVSTRAVPPYEDPEGRWGLGKEPGRHDKVQTRARQPDHCAMRFPAGRVAGKEAAPLAGRPCARLRVAVD